MAGGEGVSRIYRLCSWVKFQPPNVWLCLSFTSLYMEKDTKFAVYGYKSSSHKGAQLNGTVWVGIQPILHWPNCAPGMSWDCPKGRSVFSNLNKDANRLGGHPKTDSTWNLGKRVHTPHSWSLKYSLYISKFHEVRWLQGQSFTWKFITQKRPSGVTKDIIAITLIKKKKKAWQSMSHAQTAFQMPLINGCANYTFIAINFISIMP